MLDQLNNINSENLREAILFFEQNRIVDKMLLESEVVSQNNYGGIFLQLKSNASNRFSITINKNNPVLISSLMFHPKITIDELIGIFPKFSKKYVPYDEELYFSFENTLTGCIIGAYTNAGALKDVSNKPENTILRMSLTW